MTFILSWDVFYQPSTKDVYMMYRLEGSLNVYHLLKLDGSNSKYGNTNYTIKELQEILHKNELVHLPKSVYQLELWKISGE